MQPVGAGFSHTNNNGYVTDQDGVARDLYETLSQFFQIFPEFLTNEFYAFGESYAGKFRWFFLLMVDVANFCAQFFSLRIIFSSAVQEVSSPCACKVL